MHINRQINGLKILKIAGGSFLAMAAAEGLGLNYSASAGVITLLSIHDTKRETVRVMAKRVMAFFIALLLASLCFRLLGYRPAAVGAFLLVFTPVCILLQIQEGISVCTVLMTHFLTEGSMSLGNVINEGLLLLVGAGIGVGMNLYIPGKKEMIRRKQHRIEEHFRWILAYMAGLLNGEKKNTQEYEEVFLTLDKMIKEGEHDAYSDMENRLLSETKYYLGYMGLRKSQLSVLNRIRFHLNWPYPFPGQARSIASLLLSVSRSFHEYNNARGLLEELEHVKEEMRSQPLPADREEFEARAVLFQVLLELEQFLVIKREFVDALDERDIRMFWQQEEWDCAE